MIFVSIPGMSDKSILTEGYTADKGDWFIADSFTFGVEREMKESGEKGGTEDINIGVGELQECTISKSMDVCSMALSQYAINGNSPGRASTCWSGALSSRGRFQATRTTDPPRKSPSTTTRSPSVTHRRETAWFGNPTRCQWSGTIPRTQPGHRTSSFQNPVRHKLVGVPNQQRNSKVSWSVSSLKRTGYHRGRRWRGDHRRLIASRPYFATRSACCRFQRIVSVALRLRASHPCRRRSTTNRRVLLS